MPGQEVRGMLIRLEATTAQLRQEMAKADTTVAQVAGRIDTQLGRVDSAFDRAGASAQAAANVLRGALAGVVGAGGISELLKHAEAYTTIANRMKLVTSSAAEFNAAQTAVFDIAQRSGQPLTATAELYQRIAQNQKELKLTGQGVAGIVETISKTMVISGASAESANAALIQLGQAFASGTLRGEELNSVLEQAPALAQAIAKGMGVSVGALRSLGAAGTLTADSVVKALQAQAGAVNELFGKMQNTVNAATTRLDNSATNLIGKLDQVSGVSQKLSSYLTSVSQSLDAVSKDGASLSDTAGKVTSAVEKLAIIIGARLTLSLQQSVAAFLTSAGAAIKQAAALTQSSIAADRAVRADAASAAQTLLTAQSRQLDAKAMLEHANIEMATAEQKVAADRVRQASELSNLQAVQAALVAERGLEEQRLRAQITDQGRAQSIGRLAELRQSEVLILNQVRAAETALAETSVATSAQIQAAYQRRSAAAGAYGETTLAVNEAVAASEKTAAAASVTSRGIAGLSAAGGGLLALLTGPVGMIATVALVAASFIDFGGSTEKASKALIDHSLNVEQATQKYKELSAEQQRYQSDKWVKEQRDLLSAASSDLADYSARTMASLNQINRGNTDYQEQFARMIAEVRGGTRTLDSVTEWAKESVRLSPMQVQRLTEISAAYSQNTKDAGLLGEKLGTVSAITNAAAISTQKLAVAQQGSGQSDASKVAWEKYIEQLTKTRDLLGANAAAEAAYTAAKMGATPAQAAQAKIIADQTDTLKKYQDAIKQSDEDEKVRLKARLVALYTAEDAANDAAAAQKKALEDTAKAAEDSATRQVNAMQLVINQAVNLTKGRNLLLLPDAAPDTKNQTGYGLLTNGGTAPAPVKVRATPDQRAETAVAQLDATTEANKRVDKAANAAATAIKNQEKALTDLLAKSGISTKSANEMADAYLSGADNVRAITIQQKIEEELLKTGAGARDKVTAAVNALQDAEDRRDVAKNISEMKVEIDQVLKEATATLSGKDALDAFNVTKAVTIALAGKNIAVGSEEYNQLVATTKAQLESNKALEQAGQVEGIVDRLYPQTKLLRDYTNEQEALNRAMQLYPERASQYQAALQRLGVEYEQNKNAATSWGKFTEGAVDRIDEAFANMWESVLSKSGNFMDTLKNSFRQFLAEMLHMAITKPIIVQIGSALGVGGLAASDSGGGMLSGLFGDGGITGLLGSVKNVISVAGSKFGQAITSGWSTGDGVVGGLENAFSNGADYVQQAITSAFTTGSATAASTAALTSESIAASISQSSATYASQFTMAGAGATYDTAGALASTSASAASSSLATLSSVLGYIQGVYTIFQSFQSYGLKGAAVTGGLAAAGAYVGSFVGPIGTAVGFAIGATLGALGAGKLFSSGEKYPDQSTSATGRYVNGQYTDTGIQQGWQTKAPKYGAAADAQMSSVVQQFSTTLGMLYDTIGNGADVVAYNLLQVRKTSGKYSTTLGSRLDDGSVLEEHQQFNAADAAAALTENYDNVMGTFLAKAIVNSKSLPEYFKAQFTAFANDWDTTADEVIKAIEGVFTRFNGVNAALSQINVANLKLDQTGMIASDAILNIVASLSDLDVETATAKDKVDALNTLVNGYYSAFFTADEQFADLTNNLKSSFGGLGFALPDTRTAYRDMVEDIDVTTAAGQAMFATMMGLATAADSYYTEVDKRSQAAADAAKEAAQAVADANQAAVEAAQAATQAAASAWANYYDLFATDTDKAADTLARVGQEFSALGLALPSSRDGFVGMVAAIDQTTEAGKSLFNSLLGLATDADAAFDIIEAQTAAANEANTAAAQAAKDAAEAAAQAIKDTLNTAVTDGFSALQRAISAQQKAAEDAYNARVASLNDMLSTANTRVADLTSVGTALDNALKSLRGSSDDTVKMLRRQAQATLQSALASARAGGSLAGFSGLDDALNTVSSNNTDLYSSLEEFNRDQGRTANVVAELNLLNGKQLTNAEKSVKALQDQLDQAKKAFDAQVAQFDSQLAIAQSQLDALNGVDTSVMSVADAVNRMNAAVVAALSAMPRTGAGSATSNTWENSAALVHTAYKTAFGRDADEAGLRFWTDALSDGTLSYDQLLTELIKAGRKNGESIKIPGFATGGLIAGPGTGTSDSILARISKGEYIVNADAVRTYGTGLLDQLNGQRFPAFASGGPVLDVPRPGQVYSANQASSMLGAGGGNAELVSEIRALRAELEMIKANTQASALSASKTGRLLDRVTDGGNAVLTKELA